MTNGLENFAIHRNDSAYSDMMSYIDGKVNNLEVARALAFQPQKVNPESAAAGYLYIMIQSPKVVALDSRYPVGEYRVVGTQTVPLTGTNVVKFAQYRNNIPVYGSLVAIELDDHNSLLAVKTALGDPQGVDPIATLSLAQVQDIVRRDSGGTALHEAPGLYYYFDNHADPNRWHLVYIAKNIRRKTREELSAPPQPVTPMPQLVDYVVDAHTGKIVARLPRTQTMAWSSVEETAIDELGQQRQIRVQCDDNNRRVLNDAVLNVWTYDFQYRDFESQASQLPGDIIKNPPDPWARAAISAHANAEEVLKFLIQVLQRKGLDDRGGPVVSSINCIQDGWQILIPKPVNYSYPYPHPPEPPNPLDLGSKQWLNACWNGDQMLYGQHVVNMELWSFAASLDTVAHEVTHGLTQSTAGLQYIGESGALNESYSDIFGIIISNWHVPDITDWNWELGEDIQLYGGVPLRDLHDPTRHRQPDNMKDFIRLQPWELPDSNNDQGWVHTNSGIHNKAAYNLISANKAYGVPTITAKESASLFYLALTQYLAPTSTFVDSRKGVEWAAKTLFRDMEPATQQEKLAAIASAFDNVGITDNGGKGGE